MIGKGKQREAQTPPIIYEEPRIYIQNNRGPGNDPDRSVVAAMGRRHLCRRVRLDIRAVLRDRPRRPRVRFALRVAFLLWSHPRFRHICYNRIIEKKDENMKRE